MKLLYLANIRLPSEKGETLQVVKMCDAFSGEKRIDDVTLVVPRRLTRMRREDPFKYYGVKKRFGITRLPTIDLMPWKEVFGKLAFRLNYWVFAHLAAVYAAVHRDAVIYSRDWYILYLLRHSKRTMVFELHDFRKQNIAHYRELATVCESIVVITHGLEKRLVEAGIASDKIVVAPDAVDIKEFDSTLTQEQARTRLKLDLEKKLVVYTGHLFAWKGIHTLIDAFSAISDTHDATQLVLVGGLEEDVTRVKQYISRKKIHTITVLGHKPYRDVPVYLRAADRVVMADSSKHDISREYTSPLKLFQYMASRTPIIAPRTPALQEVLDDTNAWLFTPDDVSSLAETLQKALKEEKQSDKKQYNAWQAVQDYTWTNRAKKVIDIL